MFEIAEIISAILALVPLYNEFRKDQRVAEKRKKKLRSWAAILGEVLYYIGLYALSFLLIFMAYVIVYEGPVLLVGALSLVVSFFGAIRGAPSGTELFAKRVPPKKK